MVQKIPYVIDNSDPSNTLAAVLNGIMGYYPNSSLDVATAYFSVAGYRELRDSLRSTRSFRLLLGFEPQEGKDLGLTPNNRALAAALRGDLEALPFSEATMLLVEDLIAFLRREESEVRLFEKGFLHAKAYLFYGDKGGQTAMLDRFLPLIGIVGSSNFTGPGLRTNKELNLAHKTLIEPDEIDDAQARHAAERLAGGKAVSEAISEASRRILKSEVGARAVLDLVDWYERRWVEARDYKEELVELLDASKFGGHEYTPYQVYLKAIYEYFRDDLAQTIEQPGTRSAVELAEFQEDAVKKARKILARYDGVMISDSVGMGKTWIGKKLLEDFAYHQRMKALVVCPASLKVMWEKELSNATISAEVVTQEKLGQTDGDFDPADYTDVDVVLIDESHNFRNSGTQRYAALEGVLSANNRRGKSGERKKLMLLTATPINNSIYDLYNQFTLITGNDRRYFAAAGIGDLKKYFDRARAADGPSSTSLTATTTALFNLLEEVVIRRTRPFIRKAYPNATINGEPVRWPERELRTVRYDLEATYEGIYERIVADIERLRLPHYNLESYKKSDVKLDEFELGREEALVGIFKSRYLKRFESSVEAFRISMRRALSYIKTYEDYLMGGKVLNSRDFEKAMRFISREDEEDDATPRSKSEQMDESAEAQSVLAELPALNISDYNLKKLHQALTHDIDILTDIWERIRYISHAEDAKLQRLKSLLAGPLRGQKVLVFTYYKDTARYLYSKLAGDEGAEWRRSAGEPNIRIMDSGYSPKDRQSIIHAFSPISNNRPEIKGTDREIDVLISTDVLSEGQNLQDCGVVVNYDLHWNPTRMVQRAGRVDRIGSPYEQIMIYNFFPDAGLDRLLGLVASLSTKIEAINTLGLLDASVLGEMVNPRNFNTIKRISEEDNSVIDEQEAFIELASPELLQQELRNLLQAGAQSVLDELPDGIHSGLIRKGSRGLFFYFTAPDEESNTRRHFWRYYDATTGQIHDNRLVIAGLIACAQDTPRVTGDLDVFEVQEKVIADILGSVQAQAAVEAAPPIVSDVQVTLITILQQNLDSPLIDRAEVRTIITALRRPATNAQIKRLREANASYSTTGQLVTLVGDLQQVISMTSPTGDFSPSVKRQVTRDDLHLICFDHIVS
jgi:superfamily II DNA or RNA helicase/HKD family nuclease